MRLKLFLIGALSAALTAVAADAQSRSCENLVVTGIVLDPAMPRSAIMSSPECGDEDLFNEGSVAFGAVRLLKIGPASVLLEVLATGEEQLLSLTGGTALGQPYRRYDSVSAIVDTLQNDTDAEILQMLASFHDIPPRQAAAVTHQLMELLAQRLARLVAETGRAESSRELLIAHRETFKIVEQILRTFIGMGEEGLSPC